MFKKESSLRLWRVCLLGAAVVSLHSLYGCSRRAPATKHVVVYHDAERFAGWLETDPAGTANETHNVDRTDVHPRRPIDKHIRLLMLTSFWD